MYIVYRSEKLTTHLQSRQRTENIMGVKKKPHILYRQDPVYDNLSRPVW